MKQGAPAAVALHGDGAMVRLDGLFDQHQADARAADACLLGGRRAVELLEQMWQVDLRDTDAVVGDLKQYTSHGHNLHFLEGLKLQGQQGI